MILSPVWNSGFGLTHLFWLCWRFDLLTSDFERFAYGDFEPGGLVL